MELSYRRLLRITASKLHVYEILSEMFLILVGGSSMNHVEMDGGGGSPKVNNIYLVKWSTKGEGGVVKNNG